MQVVIWVPSFSRALPCFPLFLGSLLSRRAQYCSYLSFSGWPSIFMFSYGPAQPALGRPQDRLSAASSRASRVLQGAACPPSLAELIFPPALHACRPSGQPFFSSGFRVFPMLTRKCARTHTHFRVDVGKSGKHAEKNGWPEGRQACNGVTTKNRLRQARRTCSPLQPAARTGAGASCSEAILGPTQRMLGRPVGEHENGRPTRKWQLRTIARAPREQAS